LGFRPTGYPPCYHLGRETFLAPLRWESDGFPLFGANGRICLEHESSLALRPNPSEPTRDDFSEPQLALCWNYLRNPRPELYSLSERPGFLRLRGSSDGLDDIASPAWVGRRQRHFTVRVAVSVEFRAATDREEAGLVVRMNERHHYEAFLTRRNGAPSVVLRRRIGSLRVEEACHTLSPEALRWMLVIDAHRDRYEFLHGPSEAELRPLGEGETRYLSTEVAGGFTGVYFAMYSTGNGVPCKNPADFDWFDYREQSER